MIAHDISNSAPQQTVDLHPEALRRIRDLPGLLFMDLNKYDSFGGYIEQLEVRSHQDPNLLPELEAEKDLWMQTLGFPCDQRSIVRKLAMAELVANQEALIASQQ